MSDPTPTTKTQLQSVYINATVTRIRDGWVEVDKDLGEDVLGPEPSEHDIDEVEELDRKLEELDVTQEGSKRRRVPFEFLVYVSSDQYSHRETSKESSLHLFHLLYRPWAARYHLHS